MSTLKERIEEIMSAKDLKTGEIARAAGVSSAAVSQWLGKGNGKVINTIGSIEAASNLEGKTGYRALWIATGKGPKMAGHVGTPAVSDEPVDPFAHAILHAFNQLPDHPVVRGRVFIDVVAVIERASAAPLPERKTVHAPHRAADKSVE